VGSLEANKPRVLLVDDTPDVLTERGAKVSIAASAREALAKLRSHRPDVLISDIVVPDVDGYRLIEAGAPCHPLPSVAFELPTPSASARARRKLAYRSSKTSHGLTQSVGQTSIRRPVRLPPRPGRGGCCGRSLTVAVTVALAA
jgi:response regulator RpfG family c-di-GMP phosphodiesterase